MKSEPLGDEGVKAIQGAWGTDRLMWPQESGRLLRPLGGLGVEGVPGLKEPSRQGEAGSVHFAVNQRQGPEELRLGGQTKDWGPYPGHREPLKGCEQGNV